MQYHIPKQKTIYCAVSATLCFIFFTILPFISNAQREKQETDSLKNAYKKQTSYAEKAAIAGQLTISLGQLSPAESDEWGKKAIEDAEMSRDKNAIIKSRIDNGLKNVYLSGKKENFEKARSFFEEAATIAKQNSLDKLYCEALVYHSWSYRYLGDYDKALSLSTQAFAVATTLKNDSLIGACNISLGSCYLRKQEKLLALKNYLEAATIAERIKNAALTRSAYSVLVNFYSSLKNYDKAIDYAYKILELSRQGNTVDDKYRVITDYNSIGNLYAAKEKYDLAESFYNKSIALSDSLQINPAKYQAYISIFNMYATSHQPARALDYFKSKPDLAAAMKTMGLESTIDFVYAYTYGELNKFDSADYYYNKAAPFYETQASPQLKINYTMTYARYLKKKGDLSNAAITFGKSLDYAQAIKDYTTMVNIAEQLDSTYMLRGDYKQAYFYKTMYVGMKDSLDKLGKEDEILQIQLNDEEKRKERQLQEEEERIQKRNSLQYLAIVIAIASLFVLLTMMGLFKISERTIKAVGFFSFIMLFEFIFLVLKTQIHHYTHGEPWKDLLALMIIAAVLIPLHHWLEHKVIHYLSSRHMLALREKGKNMVTGWMSKRSKTNDIE